jgi:hypothetical protein
MPKVKDLGLQKHLDRWEADKKHKEERDRKERERQEKIAKRTSDLKAKTKYNRAKKAFGKSKGKGKFHKLHGRGITLGSIFH